MPNVNKVVTYKQLEKLGACGSQLYLFKKLFGDEVLLTEEIVMANMYDFNINWTISKLLSERDIVKYNKILKAAWKKYVKAIEIAWKEHKKESQNAKNAKN